MLQIMHIIGLEKLESCIGDWTPRDLAVMNRIVYDSEKAELSLYGLCQKRSNVWPDFDKRFHEVLLNFKGVSNLYLKGVGQYDLQIMGFDIINPTEPHGCFEIVDYEEQKIHFLCESISVSLITQSQTNNHF
jgi:hypothetical protein